MIPYRVAGLGLVLALAGCVQPPPVINVTINMPSPPAQPRPEPRVEQTSMPIAINHPMTERKWGDPLPWRADGELWQLQVCKARMGGLGAGCFSYGPSGPDRSVCERNEPQAMIDFPFEFYGCTRIYRSDLESTQGLPPD